MLAFLLYLYSATYPLDSRKFYFHDKDKIDFMLLGISKVDFNCSRVFTSHANMNN
jgi:hypothetical protein